MRYKYILLGLIWIILFPTRCIMPFEPLGMKDAGGILVVEGMIMETGTSIRLSRTVSLYSNLTDSFQGVNDARVQIIDDKNNVVAVTELQIIDGKTIYAVPSEITFTPGTKYALHIQIGGKHYQSAFVSPVHTPEIDKINWRKNPDGSMDIMVSTHDPENQTEYYRWAFEEDWEIRSAAFSSLWYEISTGAIIEHNLFTSNNKYYCWASNKSKSIILGTSDRFTETAIKDKVIHNFPDSNTRFSYLYSILVRQYGIEKEAYLFLDNLQKNIDQSGSLFAPLLTEIRGNITCLSDSDEPVIGFIVATNEVATRIFINMEDIEGEDQYGCGNSRNFTRNQFENMFALGYNIEYYNSAAGYYVCQRVRCLDCMMRGGTKNKPDFWPNDHQ